MTNGYLSLYIFFKYQQLHAQTNEQVFQNLQCKVISEPSDPSNMSSAVLKVVGGCF